MALHCRRSGSNFPEDWLTTYRNGGSFKPKYSSERTKSIVKYYAEYTGYSEDEAVDRFLTNILKDEEFNTWINNKRRKKRIMSQIFPEQNKEE